MRKDDCIFCKIANGEIPSNTIYEDEQFRVVLDVGPATKGHSLILPKNHADNLFDLSSEDGAALVRVAQTVGGMLVNKLSADGMNIVQNNGSVAGQTVMHFHLHLIPRYENDNQTINWKPTQPEPETLSEIKSQIIDK